MTDTNYKLKRTSDSTEIAVLPKMIIGRLDECEVQLMAGGASRRHAILTVEAGELWLEDLKSANGTFVNEQRLDGKIKLNHNDRIRIDVEEFLIVGALPDVAATIMKKIEPAKPEVVAADDKNMPNANLPGAWASSDNAGDDMQGRTAFMARDDLQGELASLGAAHSQQTIHVAIPTLLVNSGSQTGRRFEMHPDSTSRAEWSVGSDPGRSIMLTDSGVSALHAVLSVEGMRWKLVDKMSANGTFVNGRSAPSIYLSPGDQISFGPVKCVFLAPESVQRTLAAATQVVETAPAKSNKSLIIAAVSFGVTLLVLGAYLMLRG